MKVGQYHAAWCSVVNERVVSEHMCARGWAEASCLAKEKNSTTGSYEGRIKTLLGTHEEV